MNLILLELVYLQQENIGRALEVAKLILYLNKGFVEDKDNFRRSIYLFLSEVVMQAGTAIPNFQSENRFKSLDILIEEYHDIIAAIKKADKYGLFTDELDFKPNTEEALRIHSTIYEVEQHKKNLIKQEKSGSDYLKFIRMGIRK